MFEKLSFNVINVSGPDAATFLQGQLTCDVTKIDGELNFGACCTEKGRMIANFIILSDTKEFLLIVPEIMSNILVKHLNKYAKFSDVNITIMPIIEDLKETPTLDVTECFDMGFVWITPGTALKFIPQMIDLQLFDNGVSFTKGCYVGQEVIARTENLGKLKRHLYQFLVEKPDKKIAEGATFVDLKGNEVGILCNAVVSDDVIMGLAVIQDSAISSPIFLAGQHAWIRGFDREKAQ